MNYKVGDLVKLSDYGKECQVRHPSKQSEYGIVVAIVPSPVSGGGMMPRVKWFDNSPPEMFIGEAFLELIDSSDKN